MLLINIQNIVDCYFVVLALLVIVALAWFVTFVSVDNGNKTKHEKLLLNYCRAVVITIVIFALIILETNTAPSFNYEDYIN